MAQLDYVHSVLKLNYETLKGLISLASPSVAKTTLCETEVRASQSEPICLSRARAQLSIASFTNSGTGDRPDVATLFSQIRDDPMAFPELDILEPQRCQLSPSKTSCNM